eukprot:1154776-Rhodomonas_salina.1
MCVHHVHCFCGGQSCCVRADIACMYAVYCFCGAVCAQHVLTSTLCTVSAAGGRAVCVLTWHVCTLFASHGLQASHACTPAAGRTWALTSHVCTRSSLARQSCCGVDEKG